MIHGGDSVSSVTRCDLRSSDGCVKKESVIRGKHNHRGCISHTGGE